MHYLQRELYEKIRSDDSIFEFLQSASLDGIWYWDLENPENEWMSDRFWEVFGVDPRSKKPLASEWRDMIHPDDLVIATDNLQKHCADPEHPYDQVVRYRHRDGSTITVRCRGTAIRDAAGKPIRMLGAHNDLTKLKAAQQRLTVTNDALTKQVKRAESASRAKSVFLANMSHEVRTPLNAVVGLSEALFTTPLDARQRSMVKAVRDSGQQLLGLIEDLLDMSRIEAGEISITPAELDLHAVVETALATHRQEARHKGVIFNEDVRIAETATLVGDPRRIRQVIENLVSNAVKFTRSGHVGVRVLTEDRGDDSGRMLVIDISDTGAGIPQSDQSAVFERFWRSNTSAQGEAHGLGLGLALVKSLTDLHGGSVRLDPDYSDGTRIVAEMRLSLRRDSAVPVAEHNNPLARLDRLGPLSILVAEDNEMNRYVIESFLEGSSIKVTYVGDGRAALDALLRQRYDFALVDIRMPVMDGIEFMRTYQAATSAGDLDRIPMIAHSANVQPGQLAQYRKLGFDLSLDKPMTPTEFVDAFEAASSMAGALQS